MTDYDRSLIEGLRKDMRATHSTTENKPMTVIDALILTALGFVAIKCIVMIAAILMVL